jgi:hypothetical protein
MLIDRSRWCVITQYKENYSLFPAFVSYYRQFYGIRNFFIMCGRPETRTHESLKQLISSKLQLDPSLGETHHKTARQMDVTVTEFSKGDFTLWMASYPTHEFSSYAEWDEVRMELHSWCDGFLPKEISRTMVMDSDEFLYVQSARMLETIENIGFHFLEVIPSPDWPPRTLKFSLQGWYYRRQTMPLFKYGKGIAVSLANAIGRGLDHNSCKTFYFDRSRMGNWTAWHHGTSKNLCCCYALNRYLDQPDRCLEILKNTACCYHLAITSREHFMAEKLRLFTRLQTDPKKGTAEDGGRGAETTDRALAESAFAKFYMHSRFPQITDDFLLPYLQHPSPVNGAD